MAPNRIDRRNEMARNRTRFVAATELCSALLAAQGQGSARAMIPDNRPRTHAHGDLTGLIYRAKRSWAVAIGAIWITPAAAFAESGEADRFWGQWRGPRASGVAPYATPPVEWGDGKNIRWKVELPGHGHSTPIVWGDLVFIQTAIAEKSEAKTADSNEGKAPSETERPGNAGSEQPARARSAENNDRNDDRARGDGPGRGDGGERGPRGGPGGRGRRSEAPTDSHQFVIMALDRRSGKTVWQQTARKAVPHEGSHQDGSLAPASPLTDGKRIYAYFGSHGLYCYDMNGKLLWEKDFGDMQTRAGFGEGSSPVLHGDNLVVNWDHEGDSFIVALDAATGQQRWRKDRDEVTSWATPLVIEVGGRKQVIVPATKRIRAYDLVTGDTIWECGGLGANCIPSPVAGFGLVFTMSGHRDPALLAIRYESARGDITDSDLVAWKTDKATPYVPSPLLYGDALYVLQKNTQILTCYDPRSGNPHYAQQRLEQIDGVYASPLGADERVYLLGRNGTTYVLMRGPAFEVLAVNKLSDEFSASPVAVGRELFLRGRKHLYCIAAD